MLGWAIGFLGRSRRVQQIPTNSFQKKKKKSPRIAIPTGHHIAPPRSPSPPPVPQVKPPKRPQPREAETTANPRLHSHTTGLAAMSAPQDTSSPASADHQSPSKPPKRPQPREAETTANPRLHSHATGLAAMSGAQDTSSLASAAVVTEGRKLSPKRKQEGDQPVVMPEEGSTETEALPEAGDGAAISPRKQKGPSDSGKEGSAVGSGTLASTPPTNKKVPKSERKRAKEAPRLEEYDGMMQVKFDSEGSFATNYGYLPSMISQPPRSSCLSSSWTDVSELTPEAAGRVVLVRGWAQSIRTLGKKLTFLIFARWIGHCSVRDCSRKSGNR